MTDLIPIPFRDGEVLAVEIDGKPFVILRPALDVFGLDSEAQIRKVQRQPWATTVVTTVVAGDGKARGMVAADLRTFLMLLATIPVARVSEAARPLLIAYQREVAEVIERHFMKVHGITDEYVPFTWTLDEACAIIRQRYHLQHHVQSLTALFRTSGIWKQNGTPTAPFAWCFHFTGTAWTIHPYGMAKIGQRITRVTQQLQESYGMQMRLQLEDVELPELTS